MPENDNIVIVIIKMNEIVERFHSDIKARIESLENCFPLFECLDWPEFFESIFAVEPMANFALLSICLDGDFDIRQVVSTYGQISTYSQPCRF